MSFVSTYAALAGAAIRTSLADRTNFALQAAGMVLNNGFMLVLWLVRQRLSGPREVKRILTSLEGEGSHSVAGHFLTAWQVFQMSSSYERWVLQVHGCFSINREANDLQAFKQAVEANARCVIKKPVKRGLQNRVLEIQANRMKPAIRLASH